MKCKICGFDILEGQLNCPGCGTSVDDLKQAGNIIYEKEEYEVNETPVTEEVSEVEEEVIEESVNEEEKDETLNEEVVVAADPFETTDEISEYDISSFNEEVVQEETSNNEEIQGSNKEVVDVPILEKVSNFEETQETNQEVVDVPILKEQEELNVEEAQDVNQEVNVQTLEEQEVDKNIEEKKEYDNEEANVSSLEETSNNDENHIEVKNEKAKKGGKVGIIVITILIIVLLFGGFMAYVHFILGSGSAVYQRTLKVVKESVLENTNVEGKGLDAGFTLSMSPVDTDLAFFNNISLSMNTKLDVDKKNAYLSFDLNYNDSKLSLIGLLKDKEMYLYSPELYEQYIRVSEDNEEMNINTSELMEKYNNVMSRNTELNRVISRTFDHIGDLLKKQKYTKTYGKSIIGEKEVSGAKTTLTFTKEEYKSLLVEIYTDIKNDDQIIKDLSVILDITAQEIRESIDNAINTLDINLTSITFNIYTDITTTKFYGMDIIENEMDSLTKTILLKDGKGYLLTIEDNDTKTELNTNTKTITFKNSEYITNLSYKYDMNKKVEIPEVPNYVDLNSLTQDDMDLITSNLLSNEIVSTIINLISSDIEPDYDENQNIEIENGTDFSFNY